jgi:hypothetical protein
MEIDDLLVQSAPPKADRTPQLQEALRQLAADAEALGRPRRRAHRASLVAGVTAATAGGFIPGWVPWTTGAGSSCTMHFEALPSEPDNEHPGSFSPELKTAAANEANLFLSTFDVGSIDEAQAILAFQQAQDAAGAEAAGRFTGDDLAVNAVSWRVAQAMEAHLSAVGLPPKAVFSMMEWQCR